MITATLQNDYQVHFQSATHQWTADEPVAIGGQDSAPTPIELLLSALAGCKAVTMKMYAQRKNWSVRQIEVRVQYYKQVIVANSGLPVSDYIEVEIDVQGDLSPEQRQRLHEIAARCPIHRLLINPIDIREVTP